MFFVYFCLQSLVVGDVIYALVMGKSAAGLLLKILCNCSDYPRVVSDLGVKVSSLFPVNPLTYFVFSLFVLMFFPTGKI